MRPGDTTPQAIAAATQAADLWAARTLMSPQELGYRHAMINAALAAAAPYLHAQERQRVRQQLLEVVVSNIGDGAGVVYDKLLAAIRELSPDAAHLLGPATTEGHTP